MAGSAPQSIPQFIQLVRVDGGADADTYVAMAGAADGSVAVVPGDNATITTVTDVNATTAAAVSLASANVDRSAIIVQNLDAANDVRIGDTNIAATRGIRLGPGESLTLETTAEVFGRGEVADVTVSVTEIEA